jgi:hypothetical protein
MIINTDLKELKIMSDREYYERYLDNYPDDCLDEALSFTEYKREFLETDKLFINAITKEND